MNCAKVLAVVCLLSASVFCGADDFVVPTTTLADQTVNNTSTANRFGTQSNGNLGAANISKIDVHSLLASGSNTKVYAHLLLWFGASNHMDVGYSSTDPAQITRQINDMVSRGIDGVIIDWYGPNNSIDQATQLVMAEAEKHPGFTFAIMVDQGAIQWDSCAGCSPQQALIRQLQYVEQKYFSSPAYMTIQGRPVITNFNIDLSYFVDWDAVNASLGSHPALIFQNGNGFSHQLSDGSYSWIMPTTGDYGMSYLTSFYDTGVLLPKEQTVGAAYKGFNDTLAAWGSNRIMQQRCGKTWMQTFSEINTIYGSGKPFPYLQLVTWNDYEEGSEIESGIDDCMSISASLSGSNLQWKIKGEESAVDHYTAYISTDGKNLMTLAENPPGETSVDLCSYSIPNGMYQLFVQAVGKPSLTNQITGPVTFKAACTVAGGGSGSPPASLAFGATPLSVTIPPGKSGTVTVSAQAQSGTFNDAVALTCQSLPGNLTCSFSPATIVPGAGTASSVLTVSAAPISKSENSLRNWNFVYATTVLPFGFAGFAFLGTGQKRSLRKLASVCALAGFGLICSSCGGPRGVLTPVQAISANSVPITYTVTIIGNSSSAQVTTAVNITVQ